MHQHEILPFHAAGVSPPAAESFGQLGLAGAARPLQNHHVLQRGRDLQLVEQRIAANEGANRVEVTCPLGRSGPAELVQLGIQRHPALPFRAGQRGI